MSSVRHQLYRHFDASGQLLYVGISICAVRRLIEHRASKWFESIRRIEVENFDSLRSAQRAERKAIRAEKPKFNRTFNAPNAPKARTPRITMTLRLPPHELLIFKALRKKKGLSCDEIVSMALRKSLPKLIRAQKVLGNWGTPPNLETPISRLSL